jgi:hypothetical protein
MKHFSVNNPERAACVAPRGADGGLKATSLIRWRGFHCAPGEATFPRKTFLDGALYFGGARPPAAAAGGAFVGV